ncbi:hypothetical protein SFRURICE_016747 [Spodoptera frugiperda]|nr:hypothetical protein SFRURICE_016747 [Spodoptera frugiperda]
MFGSEDELIVVTTSTIRLSYQGRLVLRIFSKNRQHWPQLGIGPGYLDPTSLQTAARTSKTWLRIISSNKKLRNRLNHFELAIKLGSESLANYYRKNKRKPHKGKRRNYIPACKTMVTSKQTTILKSKRRGDDLTVYTKRFKLC